MLRMVHTFALFAGFKGLIGVLLKDVVRLLAGFGFSFLWQSRTCIDCIVVFDFVESFLGSWDFGSSAVKLTSSAAHPCDCSRWAHHVPLA